MNTIKIILVLALLSIFGGCKSSSGSDDSGFESNSNLLETNAANGFGTTTGPLLDEQIAAGQIPTSNNPITSRQFFGQNGNLYKARSDVEASGGGNLVVLLSASFTERFDRCEIRKNTGEIAQLTCVDNVPWTHTPYSCFANGNRQHWRANFKCDQVAEVRVTCYDANQEVEFVAPGGRTAEVCTRFG